MNKTPLLLLLLATLPALAQSSASYELSEHTFNAGGNPAGGEILTSTSFRVTLDSIAEGAGGLALGSASYVMDGSFANCFPPPGEVWGLRFTDQQTLVWDPEKSVGSYSLYRGLLGSLAGYGECEQQDLESETTEDSSSPPTGAGYFYLITASNRLDDEGPLGWDSAGAERANSVPCP